ncbi:hypothetical protein [Pseudoalteromonas xiamenensis]|uniref:Uncharacterized protein n=1 Tax=Pseudoalteromonas xiamenensis TaxID=882626 RepID=A0A975HMP5_9GAMM|nr:hypothetical protein [Pseudoalteromonas xiamenensis]QTH73212.1 hypothetical protein J5O05_20715 [Pseudoalteromonas xiamenensis]
MNIYLTIAGFLSAIAAVMHLGCIYFGAPWYRFFGAGEQMARLAEQGSPKPTWITCGVALVLSVWALYAFSGAGIIQKLPFTRLVLIAICLVYTTRGIAGFFFILSPMGRSVEFWIWSSTICLVIGLLHCIGLKLQWVSLSL